jgi:hypothetical protein
MSVLMEDAAESVVFSYVKAGDSPWIADRGRQWLQGAGVGDALVRPVLVVEVLELAQGVKQVSLVPHEGAVQEFVAAGLHPPPAFGREVPPVP